MLNEVQEDKYFVDGVFLREFKIFPNGCKPDELHPIQREFIVYLSAYSPSLDAIKQWIFFEIEKEKLDKIDFITKIDVKNDVLEIIAKHRGITINELKKQKAEVLKENAVNKLREEFGLAESKDDGINVRQELLKKYDDMANALAGGKGKPKIFKKPEFLTKDENG